MESCDDDLSYSSFETCVDVVSWVHGYCWNVWVCWNGMKIKVDSEDCRANLTEDEDCLYLQSFVLPKPVELEASLAL